MALSKTALQKIKEFLQLHSKRFSGGPFGLKLVADSEAASGESAIESSEKEEKITDSKWSHVVVDSFVFKSTENKIGYIDHNLGRLEKGDLILAEFVSNGINDGFNWYRVSKVKDINTGREYFVTPYFVTFQSMNIDTFRPNGRMNLRNDWINILPSEPQIDPQGPEDGESKVTRGGSFNTLINQIGLYDKGSAAPSDAFNYIGFRFVLGEGNK